MRVHFTVGVYQKKEGEEEWTALVPARYGAYVSGSGDSRLRDRMIERLRDNLRKAHPTEQELFQLPLGTELVRLPIDVKGKAGHIHGVTDEFGAYITEGRVHVHDLHATILYLMGLDHERLTYRYGGRDYRLTDVHGTVVRGVIA